MISLIQRWCLAWFLVVGLLGTSPLQAQTTQEAPDVLVKQLSETVLQAFQSDAALVSDLDKTQAFVDATVLPHFDFTYMTASAVGRHWRSASAEQKARLRNAYKRLLLRSYAGALTKLSDITLAWTPLRMNNGNADVVVVRSQILGQGGSPIALNYRLKNTPSGWQIYDLGVAGVWLNNSYHNQFASLLRRQSLDELIAFLEKRAGVQQP